ncbi:MAG TPA: trypsin-like peptidase domain-containing protein [Terriglobales bacterium]|nr:trypsin-like peptidase domain-containing protein [Terriglobales bacterium]
MNRISLDGISVGKDVSLLAERLWPSVVRIGGTVPGSGSGVILSADGLIVTNAHVATSERLRVELAGRGQFEAELVARDPRRDLALLKMHGWVLQAIAVADVNAIRAGDLVVALGFPMGSDAVTAGIVHAAPRDANWLIADIRVAPGNSGGPLCDVRGHLLGINTMVVDGQTLAVSARAIERFVALSVSGHARAAAAD